jgi:hypothetical protein
MPPIEHLPATTSAEDVVEALSRDGCVVVDGLAAPGAVDAVRDELEPFIDATSRGLDDFVGKGTRRTGALIARSPTARGLVMNPLILGAARGLLHDATSIRLHLTQTIAIEPGESGQAIHRDQWAFDFHPFPCGFEVQCNTLWALTDFTEENGATRVIPGSQLAEDRLEFGFEQTEPAEMERGSVLVYTGAVYHGGGANQSGTTRIGANITYARSWLRQEENQYLSVPQDVARELPDDLLRLMGYARGAYALGYVDDIRDPLVALKGSGPDDGPGDLSAVAAKLGRDEG